MNIPTLKHYTEEDIDQWIWLARRYLKRDKVIPNGLLDLAGEIFKDDLMLGVYFYSELRRYPSLKKTILHLSIEPPEPASDEPPGFLGHPAKNKLHLPDQMFR